MRKIYFIFSYLPPAPASCTSPNIFVTHARLSSTLTHVWNHFFFFQRIFFGISIWFYRCNCQWYPCQFHRGLLLTSAPPPVVSGILALQQQLCRDIHSGFAQAALNMRLIASCIWLSTFFFSSNIPLSTELSVVCATWVFSQSESKKVVSVFGFRRSKSHGTQIHQSSWNTFKKAWP